MDKTENWKPFKIEIAGHSTLTQKEIKRVIYDYLAKKNEFPQFAILDSE